MNIGAAIQHFRLQHGWNIRELERRSGVSNPYLSQIEAGFNHVSLHKLEAISKAFEMPLSDLIFCAEVSRDG